MDHPLSVKNSSFASTSASNFPDSNIKIETTNNRPPSPVNEVDSDNTEPDLRGERDTNTANGACRNRLANFLSNAQTFFSRLWHYKHDVGMGLLNIAGGLLLIFVVDLPFGFMSEQLMKGLPFFMIGAGSMQVVTALKLAYVDTCCFRIDKDFAGAEDESIHDENVSLIRHERATRLLKPEEHLDSEESDVIGTDVRSRFTNAQRFSNPASSSSTPVSSSSASSVSHSGGTMATTAGNSTNATQQSTSQQARSPAKPDPHMESMFSPSPNFDPFLSQNR